MSPADEFPHLSRALSRIPSGLFVLTAGMGPHATGMLASWVQQVGFEPPTLTVAVKKGRAIEGLIRQHGAFCISVLDEASKKLVNHFARGFEPGAPAFTGIDIRASSLGVPYPTGTLAHLVCRLVGDAAIWCDHLLLCGQVVDGDGRMDGTPLVHVRKSGFSY